MRNIIVLLLFFVSVNVHAQIKYELFSSSIGFLSFKDMTQQGVEQSGTGSLIVKKIRPNALVFFLVTNKHILPRFTQSATIDFRLRTSFGTVDSFILIHLPIFDLRGKYLNNVKFNSDGEDLVVINVTDKLVMHDTAIDSRTIFPYELLLPQDSIVGMKPRIGEDVVFLGYPSLFFDKRNISPVLRTGIIATDPISGFYFNEELRAGHLNRYREMLPEKLNGFLLSGSIFGGSSGSLVFFKPQSIQFGEANPMKTKLWILGILTTSYMDLSHLRGQKIDLGGVISSSKIKETIDQFKF